jgi:hypothetical protein
MNIGLLKPENDPSAHLEFQHPEVARVNSFRLTRWKIPSVARII